MRTILGWGVPAVLAIFLFGCGGGSGSSGSVTIDPRSILLSVGQTKAFSVTVTQCTDTRVRWSVTEGDAGGTVTSDGVYTAPTTPGTYHVVAVCDADTSVNDTATVTVL